MSYAKVVVGLPVDSPFDYLIPDPLEKTIKIGSRVWVNFCNRRKVGYVVDVVARTKIKIVKPILATIDESPVLGRKMLLLTRELADYYYCSWGEAIETALPEKLRKGRVIARLEEIQNFVFLKQNKQKALLIHDPGYSGRWGIYLECINREIENGRSVIVLLADIKAVLCARDLICAKLKVSPGLLYREQPQELEEWVRIRQGKAHIVLGTRSGIFAPAHNLGLMIIDEEADYAYKQDQMPHYHPREVAFMRANIEGADLILGAAAPTLESIFFAREKKIDYRLIPQANLPEIKIIDMKYQRSFRGRKNSLLSRYLEDAIMATLNFKGKILLFYNRKGFATFISCKKCQVVLKCPRCNINLVYHFQANILNCHYCNFKMTPAKICPQCNSSYIRYGGAGTEKIESELSRFFPQARIKMSSDTVRKDLQDADIFIATSSIIRQLGFTAAASTPAQSFDLVGAITVDDSLNRVDFRAAEKTYALLVGLAALTQKKLVIQTSFPHHHCLQALTQNNADSFYTEELKQRKELKFPPYQHFALLKVRAAMESRAKGAAESLYERLKQVKKKSGVKVISLTAGQPLKLRGNYHWQILLGSARAEKICSFLRKQLKGLKHSGIIVTVDMDPV